MAKKKNNEYGFDILSPDLIDKIPLIVIGLNPRGELLYWNRHAQSVTGYTREEVMKVGLPLFLRVLLLRGEKASGVSAAETEIFSLLKDENNILRNEETSVRAKNGKIRHVMWNTYLIGGEKWPLSQMLIIIGVDITSSHLLRSNIREKDRYIKTATNRLRKYITLDPHTGLLNYRHFMHRLNNLFYRSFERNESLSLLIMDVDYFCSINSTYGVSRGNQILRRLAALVKKEVHREFIVSRFSGTEFAILMPDTDITTAFNVAGKLSTLIGDHDFGFDDIDAPVNLSLHMAIGGYPHCEDVYTPEQLLDNVTEKLREAKAMDSNAVLICPSNTISKVDKKVADQLAIYGKDYRYTVEFVNALAKTVKTKDFYTLEHSANMSFYAVRMADCIGMSAAEIQDVRFGAILHDIGKIGIDKMILLKAGRLTRSEFEIIKQHPRVGAEIIRNVHPLRNVVPFVLYHHEKYDGTGYLNGLTGEAIPLGARIVSLADIFQALISNRPYRKALGEKEALSIIRAYSGRYFDPKIVKAFFEVYRSSK